MISIYTVYKDTGKAVYASSPEEAREKLSGLVADDEIIIFFDYGNKKVVAEEAKKQ